MPQTINDSLESKTLSYWDTCSRWHQKLDKPIETGTALNLCGSLMKQLNPTRPLSQRIWQMQEGIIQGRSKRSKATATVLTMIRGGRR